MENRVIGGMKRDVVAGQFEDPDDEVMPKRMRTTEPPKPVAPVPPPTASPATIYTAPAVAPMAQYPVPHHMPYPMAPHSMPQAMPQMMQPMHPAAAAAWQQQQSCMMSQMFAMMHSHPMMQQMQQQFHHNMQGNMPNIQYPPPPNYAPPPMHPPQQQPHQVAPLVAANPQTDDDWRIPFSHNFHPKTGLVQNPTSPANKEHALGRKVKQNTLVITPFDESILKDLDFPQVKEDAEKQFGLKESEVIDKDVLCGRGGVTNSHVGNIHYRSLADQYRWHYATAKKSRKSDIAKLIVRKIRERHGRFLKKEGDLWFEIGDELAVAKAAQTLREGLAKIYRDGLKAKMEIGLGPVFVAAVTPAEENKDEKKEENDSEPD